MRGASWTAWCISSIISSPNSTFYPTEEYAKWSSGWGIEKDGSDTPLNIERTRSWSRISRTSSTPSERIGSKWRRGRPRSFDRIETERHCRSLKFRLSSGSRPQSKLVALQSAGVYPFYWGDAKRCGRACTLYMRRSGSKFPPPSLYDESCYL